MPYKHRHFSTFAFLPQHAPLPPPRMIRIPQGRRRPGSRLSALRNLRIGRRRAMTNCSIERYFNREDQPSSSSILPLASIHLASTTLNFLWRIERDTVIRVARFGNSSLLSVIVVQAQCPVCQTCDEIPKERTTVELERWLVRRPASKRVIAV